VFHIQVNDYGIIEISGLYLKMLRENPKAHKEKPLGSLHVNCIKASAYGVLTIFS
jgi:hypothetical protein